MIRVGRVRPLRGCLVLLLSLGALLLPTAQAHALDWPTFGDKVHLWSLGGSVGILLDREDRVMFMGGLDVTYAPIVPFWISAGIRSPMAPESTGVMPYVEIGGWWVVSLGVGYSVGFGRRLALHNVNGFMRGLIPLAEVGDTLLFLEPYYRPNIGFHGDHIEVSHELGILVKYLF